ncbi:MAG TPA: ferredoxin [Marmoricola sp.]|jgi:ferredoxin
MDIRVDPIACRGHGLCAEMLPEWIRLDEWGYPILDGLGLPEPLAPAARRAARSCPELAIRLTTDRR